MYAFDCRLFIRYPDLAFDSLDWLNTETIVGNEPFRMMLNACPVNPAFETNGSIPIPMFPAPVEPRIPLISTFCSVTVVFAAAESLMSFRRYL